jgi:hypothetical protein
MIIILNLHLSLVPPYLVVMKIAGFLVVFLFLMSAEINGQSLKQDSIFLPDQLRQYQFQLEEPVEKIENLRYEKSGEPIKGTLSPDGKRVVMDHYKKGQRVKLNVQYPDGRVEEVSKSPCFIDPVSYEL